VTAVLALLLADGRFPAGGHAHSGGVEAAVAAGRLRDTEDLAAFLRGRLATSGLVAAALAAAAAMHPGPAAADRLEAEADARCASPALRMASRQQGRQLVRAATAVLGPALPPWLAELPGGPHHAVALGAVAAAGGLAPPDAARSAAYGAVAGTAGAAVRLLGLDPLAVAALVAGLAPAIEGVVTQAVDAAAGDPADLPAASAPLLDIGAEAHLAQEVRLFAS
jgi:urease accessory protein